MLNCLFMQVQCPPSSLVNALSLYFPDKEDSRTNLGQYNDITIHSDLPTGPFLSGNMAFKSEPDALIVANNLQKEINKYLDKIGKESFISVQTRYHDEKTYKLPELKQEWYKQWP